jgi:hypothetical protein
MKLKEKKLANNMSSIFKIGPSNISFGPPFEIFYPVLALTKVGSADYEAIKYLNLMHY